MTGCCAATRPEDGIIDMTAVESAIAGRRTTLTRRERALVVYRLAAKRGWGLDRIEQHVGLARSQVALILQQAKNGGAL